MRLIRTAWPIQRRACTFLLAVLCLWLPFVAGATAPRWQDLVSPVFAHWTTQQGLPHDASKALAEDGDGFLWLGARSGGVSVINASASQISALPANRGPPGDAWLLRGINAITEPYRGSVYLGTDRGLARTDLAGRQVQRVQLAGRDPADGVRALALDGEQMWLGSNDGLWRVRLTGLNRGSAERAPNTAILTQQVINQLLVANGSLWVSTREAGLFRYELATGRLTHWTKQAGQAHSLSHNNIGHTLLDRRGRLWIATLGGGLNLLTQPDADTAARFIRIGLGAGLPNLIVDAILEDKAGRIWASTDAGLVWIDPDTLAVRTLTRPDGVAILSYWINSAAQTTHGELLFGGTGGVTIVQPEKVQWWNYRPPVVISEVLSGGKIIPAGRFNPGSEAGGRASGASSAAGAVGQTAAAQVDIFPSANSITVEVATLDYSEPQQNRHTYRLDGFDQDWIKLDFPRRVAAYTNLSPGQYRLRLAGANRNGIWSEQERSVWLLVHPAWYQTLWARIGFLATLLLLIGALVQLRTRYLRRQRLELEQQVLQRTAELRQKQAQLVTANDHLNQSNQALYSANHALQDANQSLALSVDTLRHLGDIGRSITAHLEADLVFDALHRHVGDLLHVVSLTIYRMNADHTVLELVFGREAGQILSGQNIACDSPTSKVARAARERQDLMMEAPDANGENCGVSHVPGTRHMLCAMFCPLIVDGEVLGVLSIQSDRPGAYGERERLIAQTLASYGAIAMANAAALAALHQAQEQLLQQEKLAALGSLVAGVAHEINTPLGNALVAISGTQNAIKKLSSALSSGAPLTRSQLVLGTEDGCQFAALAHANATRAAKMITNFQAIAARFEGDRAVQIDLAAYFDELTTLVRTPLKNDGHQLRIEVEPGLQLLSVPEALSEALGRVLSNVCDHAFGPEMAGHGEVVLRAAQQRVAGQRWVKIEVSDNGRGIAEADLPRVFDPFFSSKNGAGEHIGLGLHVAYNHVTRRLRGKISIHSQPGQGCTVSLLIPPQD